MNERSELEGVRVVLADDHPPTRAGVRWTLERAGAVVVAEVGDATAAIAAVEREAPDVCLIDIRMPGGGGIAATRAIVAKRPETLVVILTVSRDDDDLVAAMRVGASGYLLKDIQPKRMVAAIEAVMAGEVSMPRALVGPLLDEAEGRARGRTLTGRDERSASLSPREWEVLDHLSAGASTAEVAGTTGMAPATVRVHVAAILRKLGVTTRQEAIELARRHAQGTP
jgi:two-component system nitrate/nitrite response regulator NarL